MNRTHFLSGVGSIILLILPLLFISPHLLQAEEPVKKVAVIEFDCKGNFDIPYAGSIVAEWMVSELDKLNSFILIERVLLKKVIFEQQLGVTGLLDEEQTSAQLGKIFGVDAIITGSVFKWQQSITITARLIDTSSGSILRASSITARHINKVPQLIKKLALELSGVEAERTTAQPEARPKKIFNPPPALHAAEEDILQQAPEQTIAREWLEEITGIHFIWIKPGCFVMGQARTPGQKSQSPQLYYPDENPAHRVCLEGFWMAKTETTNKQFQTLQPDHDSGVYSSYLLNHDNQPAVMVSWQDAQAFAASLTEHYENMGATFRLPSEAEWEYAARAGGHGNYPWPASDICKRTNGYDQSAAQALQEEIAPLECNDGNVVSAPVASYPANSLGLYDMIGNVREWGEDVYNPDAYLNHDLNNPLWLDDISSLRTSKRDRHPQEQADYHIGFRLVMERK